MFKAHSAAWLVTVLWFILYCM